MGNRLLVRLQWFRERCESQLGMAVIEPKHDRDSRPGAIVIVAAALMGIGLIMVASASATVERSGVPDPFWRTVFGRQGMFILAGLIVMVASWRLSPALLDRPRARSWLSVALCIIVFVCLVATFVPGWAHARHGSPRWVQLTPLGHGFGFQPSELAKLALVALLAVLLGERQGDVRSFNRGFLPAAAAIAVCVLLVGVANFSTAVLLGGVGFLTLFVAGCRGRYLALVAVSGAVGMSILLFAYPYRTARLTAYRDIWADAQGAGYQPLQSLVTIASGGWLGQGLGAGVQKYGYLPESHSDFIFAVVCEEMGLVGGGLVIGLFCVLVFLGLQVMWSARTGFERLLAFGITACLGLQAAMNIAVVTVMAPTTGIPLPLVSAGGSGLLTYSLALGVLAAMASRGVPAPEAGAFRIARHGGGVQTAGCPEGVAW
ncbi:MAG: putative lipid II flippase FtsW [Planctomycetes bacterium]|nr:putative lipid II flippase FtsW [Planctomycetota bacterium]